VGAAAIASHRVRDRPQAGVRLEHGPDAAAPDWHSDLYVFSLQRHQHKATLDPFDLAQWEFYVAPSAWLRQHLASRTSIGVKELRVLGIEPSRLRT
jgi:hypothetical protein